MTAMRQATGARQTIEPGEHLQHHLTGWIAILDIVNPNPQDMR